MTLPLLTAQGLEWRFTGRPSSRGWKWREPGPLALPDQLGYWYTDDPELARAQAEGGHDQSVMVDASAKRALAIAALLPALSVSATTRPAEESGLFPDKVLDAVKTLRSKKGHRLLPYQQAGVLDAVLLNRLAQRGCLIGDEMGLGKTVQALAVARILGWKSCLIIAPSAVLGNWQAEALEWWGRQFSLGHTSAGLTGIRACSTLKKPCHLLVSWTSAEKVRKVLREFPIAFDGVIVDEAHYGKNPKAKRTRAVWGYDTVHKGAPLHVRGLVEYVKGPPRPVLLTGTPMPNRPIEIQPLMKACAVPVAQNYEQFGERYCKGFDPWAMSGENYKGATNLDELHDKQRQAGVVRRLVDDVLEDLPPVRLQPILADPDKRALECLAHESTLVNPATRERFRTILDVQKQVAFEDLAAVRAEMALAKVSLVVEHLKGIVETSDGKTPVVVFWHHKDPLEQVAQHLAECKIPSVFIHGGVPAGQRQKVLDQFSDPNGPLIFQGTIGTCGTGINGLQNRASVCVFADYPWTPGEVAQAIGRLRRIGQRSSVLAQFLAFKGSLDAYVLGLILDKIEVQVRALDGQIAG